MSEGMGGGVPGGDDAEPSVIRFGRSRDDRQVTFDRRELGEILRVYGRMVASGEWRDYAIDHLTDRAVFSVFRRTAEAPLFRIEKNPKLAAKQGAYSVIDQGGRILKRGADLARVVAVLQKTPKLIEI